MKIYTNQFIELVLSGKYLTNVKFFPFNFGQKNISSYFLINSNKNQIAIKSVNKIIFAPSHHVLKS
jgi:hypothetical protein